MRVSSKAQGKQPWRPIHLLVVLGSGGHTEEMLSMLRHAQLDPACYARRTYVVSSGDSFSARKAVEFEKSLENGRQTDKTEGDQVQQAAYTIVTVPRARKVHQSFLTAPLSTLQCLGFCMLLLTGRHPEQLTATSGASTGYPDIILTNGPGTGVCIVVAARLLRLFDYLVYRIVPQGGSNITAPSDPTSTSTSTSTLDCEPESNSQCGPRSQRRGTPRYLRTIFIESWARVTTVSLSGKILFPLVDRFLVQWDGLAGYSGWFGFGRKAEYVGTLLS
ncbi:glycosyltransferase family protein [Arthroderma uncinatum]|uniref:glycosyltransferase family protein n=1 Tax=Arthroderma uncinatum TaxID=74035 RepID=UPI00144A88F8|nr:glycosyltransferase family protein [Arthroderma uncinatum]KAF3491853.1 glycosyltransferase family protein [Arthroderma uncinatum]